MKLILLGPPGAGKGTQANILSQRFGIAHISTGGILREAISACTPTGVKAKGYVKRGELVPDEVVTQIVAEKLGDERVKNGFMLDGFPRNVNQAKNLDSSLKKFGQKIDLVVYFQTSPNVSIQRLSGRRVCKRCGANFHLKNMPPKKEGICDKCGGELIQREDDREQTIKNRLKVYEEQTSGLIEYYTKKGLLQTVSGDLEAEQVYKELLKKFDDNNKIEE